VASKFTSVMDSGNELQVGQLCTVPPRSTTVRQFPNSFANQRVRLRLKYPPTTR
jgi:hypothetical protein